MALKCGLIGENVSRSRFGRALEILGAAHGVRLDYTVFDTALLPGFDFDRHIDRLIAEGYDGVTVTHPFKPRADARITGERHYPGGLGASNLLRFKGGIAGFNTDYSGLLAAWRAVFGDQKPGRVAMAGAGGVARAIAAALLELGAEAIVVWDTNEGAAHRLTDQIGSPDRLIPLLVGAGPEACRSADGLVNATPLGMREYPGTAFPKKLIGTQKWAFDAVYTPLETEFLRDAAAAGLVRLTGFDLFRFMAVRSFAAYTGIAEDEIDGACLLPLADGL